MVVNITKFISESFKNSLKSRTIQFSLVLFFFLLIGNGIQAQCTSRDISIPQPFDIFPNWETMKVYLPAGTASATGLTSPSFIKNLTIAFAYIDINSSTATHAANNLFGTVVGYININKKNG